MGLQGLYWEKEGAGELGGWEETSGSQTWPGSMTKWGLRSAEVKGGGAEPKCLQWEGWTVGTMVRREGRGPWAHPDCWIWEKPASGLDQA